MKEYFHIVLKVTSSCKIRHLYANVQHKFVLKICVRLFMSVQQGSLD